MCLGFLLLFWSVFCFLFLPEKTHRYYLEIISIVGKRKSGEDFTSGVRVYIVTNFILLLVSYLVQKHTHQSSSESGYTLLSPFKPLGNHSFQRKPHISDC